MTTIKYFKSGVYYTLALLPIFIASCNSTAKQPQQVSAPAVDVGAFYLKQGQLSTTVTIPGQLLPYQNVDIYPKENSFVKRLNVDIGSVVKKGDLLLTLEAPEMVSQYNEAQSSLNTKLAIYKGSKANYDRLYHTSKTPGTISPNDLDLAQARANADSAQWAAAKASFKQASELLSYLVIRAPFDGVITARNVSAGAYVGPADKSSNKPLLVLQEQNKLRLTMAVAEAFTGYLREKDTVGFTARSLPDRHFVARITRMAGGIDAQTRTEQVEMDVDNSSHKLLPQMFADIRLAVKGNNNGFILPQSALVMGSERIFVIKIVDHKAIWVDVKKVLEDATSVTVAGNLKPGDELVTNATDEIKNGTLLKVTKITADHQ
jgi:membrane fusion protein (multidrug efflux system)